MDGGVTWRGASQVFAGGGSLFCHCGAGDKRSRNKDEHVLIPRSDDGLQGERSKGSVVRFGTRPPNVDNEGRSDILPCEGAPVSVHSFHVLYLILITTINLCGQYRRHSLVIGYPPPLSCVFLCESCWLKVTQTSSSWSRSTETKHRRQVHPA